jgi:hypothetical protein
MTRRLHRALSLRTLLLSAMLLIPAGVSQTPSTQARGEQATVSSRLPPEVRLRKLHLVRPDLIQYPIQFEVYC